MGDTTTHTVSILRKKNMTKRNFSESEYTEKTAKKKLSISYLGKETLTLKTGTDMQTQGFLL